MSTRESLPVSAAVADAAVGPRANMLVLCLDQARGDWFAHDRPFPVRLPQCDALADRGISFARAQSECPICVPARRIMMTGRDPWQLAMFANADTQPFPQGPKLGELLSAAGYATAAVGKMHTWPPRDRLGFHDVWLNEEGRTAGLERGDDYHHFLRDQGLLERAYSHGLGNNQYGWLASPVPTPATSTAWTAMHACRFLERRDPTKPFACFVSFDKPHPPFTPPKDYLDLYRDVDFPMPAQGDWLDRLPRAAQRQSRLHMRPQWLQDRTWIQGNLRAYAALLTHIDSSIGCILGTLREQGVLDNTWIIIVADHGDALFDHGRVGKSDFLSGSSDIPWVIVPPRSAGFPAMQLGRRITTVAPGLADLLPTVLDALRIAPDSRCADLVGRSLLPFIAEDAPAFRAATVGRCKRLLFAHDGAWRYQFDGETGAELLFAGDDVACLFDRSRTESEVLARLRSAVCTRAQQRGDEHVQQDSLRPTGPPTDLTTAHTVNLWNNRGWRA